MNENERRIVEQAFNVIVDQDGYENFVRLPGTHTAAIKRANSVILKHERFLSKFVEQRPDVRAVRVWYLLTIKKMSLLEVYAKDSPVEAYLTRPRAAGKKARRNERPALTKTQREERRANSRKTLAISERQRVEQYKAMAPDWVFNRLLSAAIDNWPHR